MKKTAVILLFVMVFQLFQVSNVHAAPIFTITPNYTSSNELPVTVTVEASADAFTIDNCYPSVVDSNNDNVSITYQTLSNTQVNIHLPSGLSNGTYTIKIADPKGPVETNKVYTIGEFRIEDATITNSDTLISLPLGYNVKTDVVMSGAYTNWSIGQSNVEILQGSTVVDTPTVSDVRDVDTYNKTLTFSLSTGLQSGYYDVKVSTGSEVLSYPNGIYVRDSATINFQTTPDFSEGYSQTSLSIVGTNTGFDQDITTVVITDMNDNDMEKAGDVNVSDETNLAVTLLTGLSEGNYKLKVITGVEEAEVTFAIQSSSMALKLASNGADIGAIGYAHDTVDVKLVGTNTHFEQGISNITVLNSSDNDVTNTALDGAITINGQEINLSLNRDLPIGTYKIVVVTNNEQVEDNIELIDASITDNHVVYNSPMMNNGQLGEGYANFIVIVTGDHTAFSNASTVEVYNDNHTLMNNTVTSVSSNDATNLSFTVNSGLTKDNYYFVIDMDGDSATTDDQFNSNDVATLGFEVTRAALETVIPSTIINTLSDLTTVTVLGTDTHFTADSSISVTIENSEGTPVGTLSNINVVSDTELSFDVIPDSITLAGDYTIVVHVSSGGNTETTTITDGLTVSNSGIGTINPSYFYQDQNQTMSISLTGIGTSFDSSTSVKLDDKDVSTNILSSTEIEVTTNPHSLSEGAHEIWIKEVGKNPYTTSINIRPARSVIVDGDVKFDYLSKTVFVESNGTINFTEQDAKPSIEITGPNNYNTVIPSTSVTVEDSQTLTFSLPQNLTVGTYTIQLLWSSGEHSDLTLSDTLMVSNRYASLEIRDVNNDAMTNITLDENQGTLILYGYGLENGQPDADITSKATWSVISGSQVVSVNNGVITILGAGVATVRLSYDDQTYDLNLIINSDGSGSTPIFPWDPGTPSTDIPASEGDMPPMVEEDIQGGIVEQINSVNNRINELSGADAILVLEEIMTGLEAEISNEVIDTKDAVNLVEEMTEAIGNLLDKDDISEANVKEVVKDFIDYNIETLVQLDPQGKDTRGIDESAAKLVTKTIAKLSTVTEGVTYESDDSKTTVAIDSTVLNDTIAKAAATVSEFEDFLNAKGLSSSNQLVVKEVIIEIPKDINDMPELLVEIEGENFTKLDENKVGIGLTLKGVKFSLSPSLIGTVDEQTTIQISNSEVPALEKLEVLKRVKDVEVGTLIPTNELYNLDILVKDNETGIIEKVSSFDEQPIIQIPVDTLHDVDTDKLGVYVYNEDTLEWEFVRSKLIDGQLVFTAPHFSIYTVMSYDVTYSDITHHWAKDVIETLSSQHIIKGKGDHLFAPDATITRAEFATLVVSALGIDGEVVSNFEDVAEDEWYYRSVNLATQAGLVSGYNGLYRPYDNITREEMAVVIANAYTYMKGEQLVGDANSFSDGYKVSNWAIDAVNAVKYHGIVNGYTDDNTFRPQNNATRAEAAVIINNFLSK